MTTIGKQWRQRLEMRKVARVSGRAVLRESDEREIAIKIIAKIPVLIDAAPVGAESTQVSDYDVRHSDIRGRGADKLAKLIRSLRTERRPLNKSEVTGVLLHILAWCESNDLECTLRYAHVPDVLMKVCCLFVLPKRVS